MSDTIQYRVTLGNVDKRHVTVTINTAYAANMSATTAGRTVLRDAQSNGDSEGASDATTLLADVKADMRADSRGMLRGAITRLEGETAAQHAMRRAALVKLAAKAAFRI
jgi:hypothetical protein